jgi:hypothetical protein
MYTAENYVTDMRLDYIDWNFDHLLHCEYGAFCCRSQVAAHRQHTRSAKPKRMSTTDGPHGAVSGTLSAVFASVFGGAGPTVSSVGFGWRKATKTKPAPRNTMTMETRLANVPTPPLGCASLNRFATKLTE